MNLRLWTQFEFPVLTEIFELGTRKPHTDTDGVGPTRGALAELAWVLPAVARRSPRAARRRSFAPLEEG